ncbi:hypothetical protein [uncultured Polaribacter sp.]|nr:hypothetical protein [uncultured Polaribacter sp.]
MKKVVFIAICVIGFVCFSSCRSTSKSCGLAKVEMNQSIIEQTNLL